MLPEVLAGSYKRYKEDTNVFATWLSKTAKKCGYKAPKPGNHDKPPSKPPQDTTLTTQGPRLKGKARKEAKIAAENSGDFSNDSKPANVAVMKYTVTTKDLLDQATVVAKSSRPSVQIPATILRVVQRAIHARQRCADWFRTTGVKGNSSIEGHDHFIDVLQKALVILESCFETKNQELKTSIQELRKTERASDILTSSDDLANRFNMLEVEDTDDIDMDLVASDLTATKRTLSATVQHNCDVFELEINHDSDLQFAIYCFFEDLHRIQDFLKETWKMNRSDKLDLVAAAMTTNIALDLVRRAEEDIIATAPDFLAKPESYQTIASMILYTNSFSEGGDPEEKLRSSEILKLKEFDEFIYISTALPPFRTSYTSRPELFELVEVKKQEDNDRCLSQLLMDMSCHDGFRKMSKERGLKPVEDELSNSLLKLRKDGEVSVWNVFAATIFLDIQDILGNEIGQCYQELRHAAVTTKRVLDLRVEGKNLMAGGSGDRWLAQDGAKLLNLYNILTFWIIDNSFPILKNMVLASSNQKDKFMGLMDTDPILLQHIVLKFFPEPTDFSDGLSPKHIDNTRKLDIRLIKPATETSFLFLHNPIYCGTLAFNLMANMEEVGITLANHYRTISAAAHLYNALQQMRILEGRWPEMDHLIKLQIKPLFAGQLPVTPTEFHTRSSFQLGLSTRNFTQSANYSVIRGASKREIRQIASTPTSNVFCQYFDRKETLQNCLYRLEALIKEKERSGKSKKHIKSHFTPLELLEQVRDWLSHAVPDMRIDYIPMTRSCSALLENLRSIIHQRLGLYEDIQQFSETPLYACMTVNILAEAREMQHLNGEVVRRRMLVFESPQLAIAGEVMQKFLNERGFISPPSV